MKVTKVELDAVAGKSWQFPQNGLPEIAFAGRSNVGKSSLINRLTNRKSLARTSGTPGKTRTLNFYLVNESFYIVDLPGYGYARVSHQEREAWRKTLEEYFLNREQLAGAVQILDIRHNPSAGDKQMFEALMAYRLPLVVVATKADKIPKGKLKANLGAIERELGLKAGAICFSAKTGFGKDEVWKAFEELLKTAQEQ